MSTRSDIIVHRADGKWSRVYCHFDGYLEGVGATLQEHYNDQDRAELLVSQGDISTLHARCDKPPGHSYDKRVEGCTVYYGRDRGEKDTAAKVKDTLAAAWPSKDSWTEFTYVFDQGKWYVADPDEGEPSLIELGDALAGKKTIHPAIKAFGLILGRH